MKKFLDWMNVSFSPKMNKINHNIYIVTLKDSINQTMPLIFLGSIFSLLTIPGSSFEWSWWPDFGVLNGWTMGMISLMISFLIPFNFMEKNKLRKNRIIAGMSGIILFAIVITPQLTNDGAIGLSHASFGAGGMFVAILAGVIVGVLLKYIGKFSFFKKESIFPDFIRAWFDQMLPIAVIILLGWVVVDILNFDIYNLVLGIFSPLKSFTETYWGFLAIQLITVILYSMGISVWVLTPITTPLKLAAIAANIDGATNIFTHSFVYAYLTIGGVGCTLGLVIMLMTSKSFKLKALGRVTIIPSIFNINEPVVFGAIAWNPILMVPMWVNALVSTTIAFLFTRVIEFAPIPQVLMQLWYLPPPIATWLATSGSIAGVILVFVIFIATTLVWYPFFKIYEKQCILEENM